MLPLSIHPVIQSVAILLSIYAASLSLPRILSLHFGKRTRFNRDRHVILGSLALVILLGGIAGGVVWNAWSFFIQMRLGPFYEAMQKRQLFLDKSRYPFFAGQWILLVFVMSILLAYRRVCTPRSRCGVGRHSQPTAPVLCPPPGVRRSAR